MRERSYQPIYDAPCWDEQLEDRIQPEIRQQIGPHVSRDMVFVRRALPIPQSQPDALGAVG